MNNSMEKDKFTADFVQNLPDTLLRRVLFYQLREHDKAVEDKDYYSRELELILSRYAELLKVVENIDYSLKNYDFTVNNTVDTIKYVQKACADILKSHSKI